MISRLASLALLGIFSSLSINLVTQFGLGMAIVVQPQKYKMPFIKTALAFVTMLLLWLVFSKILPYYSIGLLGYVLCFPIAALIYSGFKKIIFSIIRKEKDGNDESNMTNDALLAASLFIMLNISGNFIEAVSVSLGIAIGFLLAIFIIREIQYRSEMEAVPQFLRGSPLIIISMGLLSLIFGAAALLFFKAIGG